MALKDVLTKFCVFLSRDDGCAAEDESGGKARRLHAVPEAAAVERTSQGVSLPLVFRLVPFPTLPLVNFSRLSRSTSAGASRRLPSRTSSWYEHVSYVFSSTPISILLVSFFFTLGRLTED